MNPFPTKNLIRHLAVYGLISVLASLAAAQQTARTDFYEDPLPEGAVARLGTSRLKVGNFGIGALSFAPDGKKLISLSTRSRLDSRQRACLWDAQSGKLLYSSQYPATDYVTVALSPDGKLLAVNGPDGLLLQDTQTGQTVSTLAEKGVKHESVPQYHPIQFSPDGSRLMATGNAENVVWDVKSGKKLFGIPDHHALTFSPDSKRIAGFQFTEEGSKIDLFDADGGKLKSIDMGKAAISITKMAFAADGVTLAICRSVMRGAGDIEETVWLYNADTGEKIRSFAGHPSGAATLALTADAKILVTGDYLTMRIFNAATGKLMHEIRYPGYLGQVAISPDGSVVAASGQDGVIRLWDVKSGKQKFADRGHQAQINAVAIRLDGKQIATAGADGTVRLWDAATGKELLQLDMPVPEPIATSEPTSTPTTASAPASAPAPSAPAGPPSALAVAVSPDGTALAASTDNHIVIWRLPSAEQVTILRAGAGRLSFSPDGKTILSPGPDDSTLVWDIAQQKVVRTTPKSGPDYIPPLFGAHHMLVRDRCAEPRGQFTACVWSVWPAGHQAKPGLYAAVVEELTLQPVAELEIEKWRSMAVWGTAAFSPNARFLATAGCDGPILAVWDLPSAQKLRELDGHTGVIFALAFAADGKKMVSAGMDGTALVWDVDAITKRPTTASAPATGPSNDLAALLADLGGEDAAKAYAAMWALVDLRDKAGEFLAAKLEPVAKLDAAAIKQIVADLDSETFAIRKKAVESLNKLGPSAMAAMKEALKDAKSAEVKSEIEGWLSRQTAAATTGLEVRAVYVLERIGTDKARKTLKSLADGLADAPVTKQAKVSLERLGDSGK